MAKKKKEKHEKKGNLEKEKKLSKIEEKFQQKIMIYALANAIPHQGKAQAGAVLPKLFQDGLKKEQIKEIMPFIQRTVNKINSTSLTDQEIELKKIAPDFIEKKQEERDKAEEEKGLPELPNPSSKMVLRLAPYPSGALHIGNAKTYLLNALYAEKYKAKLLLVIDDTIGSEEKQIMPEAYKLIPEAFEWLQVHYEKPIFYKSDRLNIYYKHAEQLIKKDKAYVCFCSSKALHEHREKGLECEHRKHSAKQNLEFWNEMLKGKFKEGQAILRIKTSMKDPNPAFRDRVLFRLSSRVHPRVGKKYKVWPMLEFSWAIDDHLLGVTHIIRGKDLMIESEMEKFIWKIFGWKPCELLHAGLVRIEGLEGVKLSKSKAQKEVKSGKFTGWDDPRTWSIQSLRRRGIKAEAIREFVSNIGLNQNDIVLPIETLYSINKKIVESSNRYFFVQEPVKIKIKNSQKIISKVPFHPDHAERGNRIFTTLDEFYVSKKDFEEIKKSKEDIFRFMNLFNFKKDKQAKNFEFHSKEMQPLLKAKLLHWLPADKENAKTLVQCEILMPDGEILKGLGESSLKEVEQDNVIQFERFGFCRLDKKGKDKMSFWFTHR